MTFKLIVKMRTFFDNKVCEIFYLRNYETYHPPPKIVHHHNVPRPSHVHYTLWIPGQFRLAFDMNKLFNKQIFLRRSWAILGSLLSFFIRYVSKKLSSFFAAHCWRTLCCKILRSLKKPNPRVFGCLDGPLMYQHTYMLWKPIRSNFFWCWFPLK